MSDFEQDKEIEEFAEAVSKGTPLEALGRIHALVKAPDETDEQFLKRVKDFYQIKNNGKIKS